jgi:hypothetical protein
MSESDTPRSKQWLRGYDDNDMTLDAYQVMQELERELANMTKQRDTLAEALKLCEKHLEKHGYEKCNEESDETGWWLLCDVRNALAAIKGESHDTLQR